MSERVAQLCQAIRLYLAANPNAADSETGVRQWRLGGLGFEVNQSELRGALERLLSEGVLGKEVLTGGVELYSGRQRKAISLD